MAAVTKRSLTQHISKKTSLELIDSKLDDAMLELDKITCKEENKKKVDMQTAYVGQSEETTNRHNSNFNEDFINEDFINEDFINEDFINEDFINEDSVFNFDSD